ncbi:MAG: lipopolysaccharide kinase InaA family protein [Desulfobacterales bacterium]
MKILNIFSIRRAGKNKPQLFSAGKYRIAQSKSSDAEWLLKVMLNDPEALFLKGEPLQSPWRSDATDKVLVQNRGKVFLIKRYNCPNLLYRLKSSFRRSRAEKSWDAAWILHSLGLSTPLPILFLEERRCRLLRNSYIVFPYLNTATSLLVKWPELNNEARKRVLTIWGNVIGKMHLNGFSHGDLNWRNLLLEQNNSEFVYYIIDLDGYRFSKRVPIEAAQKDLSHFYRDIKRMGATQDMRDVFTTEYKNTCH